MNSRILFKTLPNVIYGVGLRNTIVPTYFYSTNQAIFQVTQNVKKPEYFQHYQARYYAKSKDKGGKDKKNQGKTEINLNQLSTIIDVDGFKNNLQAALDSLQDAFVQHISLRTSSGSLEALPVSFEGKKYELQELAQVVRKNPKTVILNMATFPQSIPSVIDAINSSGLNLNPQQDGTTIFIPIPKVTKEHRELLGKNAKVLFNKCTNKIKEVQIEQFKKMKKQTGISEDIAINANKQVMAITNEYLEKARVMQRSKMDELTKIN